MAEMEVKGRHGEKPSTADWQRRPPAKCSMPWVTHVVATKGEAKKEGGRQDKTRKTSLNERGNVGSRPKYWRCHFFPQGK